MPRAGTRSRTQPRSLLDELVANSDGDVRAVLNRSIDHMLHPDPNSLRRNVHVLLARTQNVETEVVLDLLVERSLIEGSALAASAVGYFGIRALSSIRLAFLKLRDSKSQTRLVDLVERLAPHLTQSEYFEVASELLIWPRLASNDSAKAALADAQRALRRSFEA